MVECGARMHFTDSITRLHVLLTSLTSGKVLSGGVKLAHCKNQTFGAARNIENGLIDDYIYRFNYLGSRMDEVIFEEFKVQ